MSTATAKPEGIPTNATDTASTFVETVFVETNGIRLHTLQAGDPEAPLVILLHGFPECAASWHHQIPALVNAGYRVIAPDQRGYNLSEKPGLVQDYRIQHLVADVAGILDAEKVESAIIVGHDWGAAVAWAFAGYHPNRTRKLVVMNVPHPAAFQKHIRSSVAQLRRSWYMFFFQIPYLPEWGLTRNNAATMTKMMRSSSLPDTFSEEDLATYRQAWLQPNAMRSMIHWYRALLRSGGRGSGATRRISVPTLILWGKQDIALGFEMAEDSLNWCDDGRLIAYENATHWVQNDLPHEVNQALIAFLGQSSPG